MVTSDKLSLRRQQLTKHTHLQTVEGPCFTRRASVVKEGSERNHFKVHFKQWASLQHREKRCENTRQLLQSALNNQENQAEEARLSLPLLLPQESFSESEQNAEENVGFALLAFGNTVDDPSHGS